VINKLTLYFTAFKSQAL